MNCEAIRHICREMAGLKDSRSKYTPVNERVPSTRTIQLGRVQPQPPSHRTVYCNDRDSNALAHFKGNSISTTKYNILTFLPKGLYEQFRRVANFYFLLISMLSFTPVSPISPITNVLPLSIVLFVSLVKEAFEDWVSVLYGGISPDVLTFDQTGHLEWGNWTMYRTLL